MKLSQELIEKIIITSIMDSEIFKEYLESLDLVFKNNDSSQSVLVEEK